MQWVSVLSLLSAASVILANDNYFNDAIEKYADHCTEKYTTPGFMTIAYLVGNKNVYGRIDAFDVETFSTVQSTDTTAASRLLVQTACVCTEIKLNSYEFIVVPLMIDGIIGDALTVCVFHEVNDEQEVTEILSMPGIGFLRNWMTAQYYVHMIRTLNAPAADVTDCIGKDGHPVNNVIGQRTCYYVNYAKFEEGVAAIDVEQKLYYGPFLGSMIPNLMELAKVVDSDLDYLDFVTRFDYVKCSLLKNHSRIDSSVLKTGCRFEAFRDNDGAKTLKLVVVSCCCSGKDDPNCREVTSAVKEKKTLCVGGTDQNPTFFFAKRCSHNVVKEYKRIEATDGSTPTFEHSKALRHESTTATFEKDAKCKALQTVTCRNRFVYDTDEGCCSGPHFCNLHRFLNLAFKRCSWSFGAKQEIDGCRVIFYRADDRWYTSSSLWFEMKQTELIHLFSVAGNEILRALLVEKNVDPTCNEHTERYARDYFVVSCHEKRNCDRRFTQNDFFKSLDEKVVIDAMRKDSLPRCETGNVSFTKTDSVWTMPSVSPNTTRVIGLYCNVRLTGIDENNSTAIITFEPVFPKPENCIRQVAKRDNSTYTCCYPANSNASFIDEDCHYSTILEKAFPPQAEVTTPEATTESTDLIPQQSVHVYADYCEQSNMDDLGVPSLQCQPGGIGCFHLLEMDEARDEVIASCIGHAEKKVAASKQFFDQYHEALLCQAEELKNKCQYVVIKSGVMPKLLCCCEVSVVIDNVAYCVEDTNTMFNEYKFELKTIGEYRDVKDDDEDDEADTDDE